MPKETLPIHRLDAAPRRVSSWGILGLVGAIAMPAPRAAETLALRGTVTNTTHEVTAPAQLEVAFTGDQISGFLTVEEPLHAGRWPVTGARRGAWCEIVCVQMEKTQVTFRGVLGADRYRGTYSFTGDAVVTQYGQFDLSLAPRSPKASPPAQPKPGQSSVASPNK